MHALRLYARYAGANVRAQMQYPASFAMQAAAHFLVTAIEFVGIAALFARFGQLRGWTLPEVGLLYGIIGVAFALSEGVARGFDVFGQQVRTGDFDRVLLRPRSAALQVLGQELQLMRVGRLAQATAVLAWSAATLGVAWSPARIALVVAAVLGGACLFGGLWVLQATLCFWTVESIEMVNCATYGGVEAGQFPLTVYKPWFRAVLTFVLPLATINWFPVHALLGRADAPAAPWVGWLSPLAGIAFLLASLLTWRLGVRRYTSTGT